MPVMTTTRSTALATPDDVPLLARRLGYAGLIPFAANALLIWNLRQEAQLSFVTLSLVAWGAVILSFMAAIPWGIAMLRPELGDTAWWVSSLFAGIGWVALLMPAYAGLVVIGVLLVACYLFDRRFYPRAGLGHWLMLRFRLSMIAAFCCFLGAAGV